MKSEKLKSVLKGVGSFALLCLCRGDGRRTISSVWLGMVSSKKVDFCMVASSIDKE